MCAGQAYPPRRAVIDQHLDHELGAAVRIEAHKHKWQRLPEPFLLSGANARDLTTSGARSVQPITASVNTSAPMQLPLFTAPQ